VPCKYELVNAPDVVLNPPHVQTGFEIDALHVAVSTPHAVCAPVQPAVELFDPVTTTAGLYDATVRLTCDAGRVDVALPNVIVGVKKFADDPDV
jgi:hypothetical protein